MSRQHLFSDILVRAITRAESNMPGDVLAALQISLKSERTEVGRMNLQAMLDNVFLARERAVPMCQDTGMVTFFVDVGEDFPFYRDLRRAMADAVAASTCGTPLRPNTVEPFTGSNPGNNLGMGMPLVHWNVVEGDHARIIIAPKGGGSENAASLSMMPTSTGENEIRNFVLENVLEKATGACPPIIIGMGVGGSSESAVLMAKKACLRPMGGSATSFESRLLEDVNSLGIGPMGMGGSTTALAVNVEQMQRHPATFPVALAMQCWAVRRVCLEFDAEGESRFVEDAEWG